MEMKHFTHQELMQMETRFRASFINSLGGFKSVALIGTKSKDGMTNLAIFNSFVHIGANPPYIGFISRPDSVDRHTLENLQDTSYYTINHLNESIFKAGHHTSARFRRDQSEFDETGLTPLYRSDFWAPFVAESHVQLGVKFIQAVTLEINGTLLVIGKIEHVYFPSGSMCTDGFLDLEKAGSIAGSGLDSYHATQRLDRLTYAKPDSIPQSVVIDYLD